jgi:hypothetical protein
LSVMENSLPCISPTLTEIELRVESISQGELGEGRPALGLPLKFSI